jgi:hypothetical protein
VFAHVSAIVNRCRRSLEDAPCPMSSTLPRDPAVTARGIDRDLEPRSHERELDHWQRHPAAD